MYFPLGCAIGVMRLFIDACLGSLPLALSCAASLVYFCRSLPVNESVQISVQHLFSQSESLCPITLYHPWVVACSPRLPPQHSSTAFSPREIEMYTPKYHPPHPLSPTYRQTHTLLLFPTPVQYSRRLFSLHTT